MKGKMLDTYERWKESGHLEQIKSNLRNERQKRASKLLNI